MSIYSLDDSEEELPPKIRKQLLDLHKLDAEYAKLKLKLSETRTKRDVVYCQLEQFCELRAPIRRVPCEVLAIIFDNHPEVQESRNSALMRVCKMWRQIVMGTPRLWNHISLNLQKIDDLPLLWKYARRCLIYSASLPLYVHLDARDLDAKHSLLGVGECFDDCSCYIYSNNSSAEESVRPFIYASTREDELVRVYECVLLMTLSILRGEDDRFLKRWRSFHCYICLPYDYNKVADTVGARVWDSIDGMTDNLVDLELLPDFSSNEDWHPTGFKNLKSLKSLLIRLDVSFDRLALPASTLERLIIVDPTTSDHFLDFASDKFVSLQLLQLEISDPENPGSTYAIHLPALRVLALFGYQYGFIMKQFQAPGLTHLRLSHFPLAGNELPSILNTVTDVMWTLHKENDAAGLMRLLGSTPSLKRIHLRRYEDATQDLAILETRPDVHCTEDAEEWPYIIPFYEYENSLGM